MIDQAPADVVCLNLPRENDMSRILRLAASAVASKTGLNLDQSDDLQTALDELFRLYLSETRTEAQLCFRFQILPDRLEVVTQGISRNLFDEENRLNRFSRFILENVADRVDEIPSPQGGFEIILVKNVAGPRP